MDSRSDEFLSGFRETFPLVIGAIPFGIIYGAVAITSGLSPTTAMSMSTFVFAGSAQFIATGMVSQGAGLGLILVTTFIVNLRHMLYSASLAPHMKHLSQRWLLPLAFFLTDETYAVTIARYNKPDPSPLKHWFFFGSAVFMYTNWQICTYIGIRAGQAIPDPLSWGLDFAMVVTFIGMVIPNVKSRASLVCVIITGVSAVITYSLPNKLGLILSAMIGIIAGLAVEGLDRSSIMNANMQNKQFIDD